MLTYEDLVRLARDVRDESVLSVYLPGTDGDPAQRDAGRTRLDTELSRLRRNLEGGAPADRAALATSIGRLDESLGDLPVGGRPVVAFVSDRKVLHSGRVLAPVPFLVQWGKGIVAAPYVRSLKQERPVLVIVVDSRSARLLRYHVGEISLLASFEATSRDDAVTHLGESAHPPVHPGVRGSTGRDEGERRQAAAFERMVGQLAKRIESERQAEPWLVVGGMPERAHGVLRVLPRQLEECSTVVTALTGTSTLPDIARVASVAASELTARRDAAWVEATLNRDRGTGRSATGLADVTRALEEHAVRLLLMSSTLAGSQLQRADQLVRAAFDGGAEVEVVTGVGAGRLDAECEGVAAELRFSHQAPTHALHQSATVG